MLCNTCFKAASDAISKLRSSVACPICQAPGALTHSIQLKGIEQLVALRCVQRLLINNLTCMCRAEMEGSNHTKDKDGDVLGHLTGLGTTVAGSFSVFRDRVRYVDCLGIAKILSFDTIIIITRGGFSSTAAKTAGKG